MKSIQRKDINIENLRKFGFNDEANFQNITKFLEGLFLSKIKNDLAFRNISIYYLNLIDQSDFNSFLNEFQKNNNI
jgi:hypothetical protein